MMSEKQSSNILENYFETKGFVNHQVESYDRFLNFGIQEVLEKEAPIEISNGDSSYKVTYSDVYVPPPSIMEMDRTVREYYPAEARRRNLTYDTPVYVKVTEHLIEGNNDPIITVHPRVVIARIPIMLRSDRCNLSKCTPKERVKYGECPKDEGGYFIMKGIERVLIGQIRNCYNIPLVFSQKNGSKYTYICEVRSMSESTGHSTQIKAALGKDDRSLIFLLPHLKDKFQIPCGIVFKALGIEDEKIEQIIGLKHVKAKKYINLILRDYCISETVEDALDFIGRNVKVPVEKTERVNYAKNIIEKELFPHLGITISNKEVVYFLGFMINKLLSTHLGLRKDDNRDNYMNKRIEISGVLCNELFRQLYKRYLSCITASLEKKKQGWDVISTMSRVTVITKGICKCFSTGKWGAAKTDYVRVGVSQVLSRLSYGATLSHLRRINIPIGKEAKNSKIRQIDESQIMFICPAECFDPVTKILMWNGETKLAKDIVVGDMLIDDNGNPTRVRKTCSGTKNMYDVIPEKKNFEQHRVTDNHILTLRIRQHKQISKAKRKGRTYTHALKYFNRDTKKYQQKYFNSVEEAQEYSKNIEDDDTIDITIDEYLKLNKWTQDNLVLFKSEGINWEHKPVDLDPYLLGMWLGDGLSTGKGFALNYKTDPETLEYWYEWARKNGIVITKGKGYDYSVCSEKNKNVTHTQGMCNRVEEAPLKKYLRKYNLIGNKHIPLDYITNDRKTRLSVLAGLIDTDGSVCAKGREIRICQGPANYRIVEDAHKLAISLGFSCGLKEGRSQWTDEKSCEKKYSTYKELTITGAGIYEIPTLLPRKKLAKVEDETQLTRSKSFMGSKFTLKESGVGPYVGWQLEDDRGRFTLGSGLVVHNTPEGQPVGIVLNLSLLTRVSHRRSTILVREAIEKADALISMSEYDGDNEDTKVFHNGVLVGMCEDAYELLDELKLFRGSKMIPWDVSISYDDIDEEIHIASDEGRLIRPVFTVDGDKLEVDEKDGCDWEKLVEDGKIVYVDNAEINNAVVAFYPSELKKYRNDYCEIDPAMMLGIMGSIIPFPDHSQSPRNCYQCLDPNTPVVMADGTQKYIKDINVGDKIITVDPQTCKQSITNVINQYVRETDKDIITIETESGRKITCTYDHPVLTTTGWKFAQDAKDICVIPQQTNYSGGDIDLEIYLPSISVEKKHQIDLEKLDLYPVKGHKLPILARMTGYLLSDGSAGIYSKGPQVQFVFGSPEGCQDFLKDIKELGFHSNKVVDTYDIRYGKCQQVIYNNAFASLMIALLGQYTGKRSTQKRPQIMKWIKNGSKLVKREFLAGFQGGDGCKFRYNSLKDRKSGNFVLNSTSQTTRIEYVESLVDYMNEIKQLFEEFGIECTGPTIRKAKDKYSKTVHIYFKNTRDNLINYFERIGWRYDLHKYIESLSIYEYHKMCQQTITNIYEERKVIMNMMNDAVSMADIAKCLNKKVSYIRDSVKSVKLDRKPRLPNSHITFSEWNRTIKDRAIFVKITNRTPVDNNIIADITTESSNHSFIAGDSFCVHNSAMGKQAMGMVCLSHLIRTDTMMHVLQQPQKPLVYTKASEMMGFNKMASGINAIVAIMCYGG